MLPIFGLTRGGRERGARVIGDFNRFGQRVCADIRRHMTLRQRHVLLKIERAHHGCESGCQRARTRAVASIAASRGFSKTPPPAPWLG